MIVRLHWWKEFRKDGLQNYGDLMSKYLVQKLSKKIVFTTRDKSNTYIKKIIKPYYIVIGSIIGAANKNAIVWGSRKAIKIKLYIAKVLSNLGLGYLNRFIITHR
ncbi:hypothetical protein SAMN04489722_106236 [Algibacter lectus]|uniref:hypothetical protein n=1 Tax=Algibacter lectus TaxID=221126 RepID=UPI0008E0A605|nr:hypothetical protein [Algibacter lectus]SFD25431.1 hypothetical protein SAMN04489722_106236 [Algibacter lectus]